MRFADVVALFQVFESRIVVRLISDESAAAAKKRGREAPQELPPKLPLGMRAAGGTYSHSLTFRSPVLCYRRTFTVDRTQWVVFCSLAMNHTLSDVIKEHSGWIECVGAFLGLIYGMGAHIASLITDLPEDVRGPIVAAVALGVRELFVIVAKYLQRRLSVQMDENGAAVSANNKTDVQPPKANN